MDASNPNKFTLNQPSLNSHGAERALQAALKKANELGLAVSVCILDGAGRLKAFHSMDGAPAISHETSQKKAKLALGFGIPTGQTWYQFIQDDPILLHGAQQLPDFILLGGGLPLKSTQGLMGAVGVSGGHYKQDELIGQAAAQALN
jgi:uncharacterized protein GlcG (DUF336 family)